jgi:pilus assembly protein CpaB
MRFKTLIMLGLAVVFGVAAMLMGNQWLMRQAAQNQPAEAARAEPAVPMGTLVVASVPLRYGTELTPSHLKEIRWPEEAVPPGAFRRTADILAPGVKRVVLAPMEPNEPVMALKVTGPGQRGTLSSLLEEGMGAVTVRVNDVLGVAGFVLPGDRIDLVLTRQPQAGAAFSDVVLQNVRVLAAGQVADERAEKPTTVTTVTVAVDPVGAQKIALASTAGTLSLVLRRAGEQVSVAGRRVTLDEIGQQTAPKEAVAAAQGPQSVTVRVTRAMKREDYRVPSSEPVETATAKPRVAQAGPSPEAPVARP